MQLLMAKYWLTAMLEDDRGALVDCEDFAIEQDICLNPNEDLNPLQTVRDALRAARALGLGFEFRSEEWPRRRYELDHPIMGKIQFAEGMAKGWPYSGPFLIIWHGGRKVVNALPKLGVGSDITYATDDQGRQIEEFGSLTFE
jgi:hypothetical protein